MKVAFCSSEVFPFAKTGGLGDVSGALSQALARAGCEVKVFMPLYKNIEPQEMYDEFGVSKQGEVEFFFIKNDDYFRRKFLYTTSRGDYPDNLERFSFFSKQIYGVLKRIDFSPHIIHSNDWQTSLMNIYLKIFYKNDTFFKDTKCILTIHNLAYQGIFEKSKFPFLGISWDYFNRHYLEFYGKVNLLKGGIIFSDRITTVSPVYAEQIQISEYGCGLDEILKKRKANIAGILNAVDYSIWNPQIDEFIYKKYSPDTIEGKTVNKIGLQEELSLKVNKDVLLIGMISRLVEQKGIDILSQALEAILKKYQLVILGVGESKYYEVLRNKGNKFKGSFSFQPNFDEVLAHKIYAASDIFLMPSRFEPCGLSQMISYKYAAIPLVHHTGGLIDTVVDVSGGGGGFVFKDYASYDLVSAVERAGSLFVKKKDWLTILDRIVQYDFSWDTAAAEYIKVYKQAVVCKSRQYQE